MKSLLFLTLLSAPIFAMEKPDSVTDKPVQTTKTSGIVTVPAVVATGGLYNLLCSGLIAIPQQTIPGFVVSQAIRYGTLVAADRTMRYVVANQIATDYLPKQDKD